VALTGELAVLEPAEMTESRVEPAATPDATTVA
jgi:hypothetical protein